MRDARDSCSSIVNTTPFVPFVSFYLSLLYSLLVDMCEQLEGSTIMVDYRLCNVLVNGPHFEQYPEMYIRQGSVGLVDGGSGSLVSSANVRYDFATYFNALSLDKWLTYTTIDAASLRIEAKGSYEVVYTGYRMTNKYPMRVVFSSVSFDDEEFAVHDFAYPQTDCALVAFEIVASESFELRDAYYFAEVDEAQIRDVELAVSTTTFQKEEFVIPNIKKYESEILGCDEPIASHFTLHVVDNGRTLDVDALSSDRVRIHPNPNVGGAGGFARGMMEAVEQEPKATHVLLMDDDVQVCPESLKRTFNLLSLVKDEYARSFVSGAMLSLEKPDEFHEDIGFVDPSGAFGPTKKPRPGTEFIRVTDLYDVVMLETRRYQFENRYAAWWYCAIPIPTIEERGLSLPIFIRCDDAEYSNRAADGILSMNGICIWHLQSTGVFRAALERYYPMRNTFVTQAASGIYGNVDFMLFLNHYFGIDIKTFNYDAAELCLIGFEDFLKGPEYLKHLQTDELNRRISQKNETLRDMDELLAELPAGIQFNPNALYAPQERSLNDRVFDFATANGQRGPKWLARGGLAIIPFDGFYYAPNEVRGKDTVLAVTLDGTKGVLRRKDRERAQELLRRYDGLRKEYEKRKDEVTAQWAQAQHELTSLDFWKWYLKDQAEHMGMELDL